MRAVEGQRMSDKTQRELELEARIETLDRRILICGKLADAFTLFTVASFAFSIIFALLSDCNSTGPAYDPETKCTVDTARAEIICRDKP